MRCFVSDASPDDTLGYSIGRFGGVVRWEVQTGEVARFEISDLKFEIEVSIQTLKFEIQNLKSPLPANTEINLRLSLASINA